MTRLRIDLAYDGEPFSGFARQRDRTTVQGTLEDALARVLGQPVTTTCAGRTDRGVHALAQVVHLDVDTSPPAARRALDDPGTLRERLGHLVGRAITVWSVRVVSERFDARFSAETRGYRYRLVDASASDPVLRFNRWQVGEPLDLTAMRSAAGVLEGEHDFASFCRRATGRTTVRRLERVTITRPRPGRVDLRFTGTAFCHQQVRSLVGCLVEVGRRRRDPAWMGDVLESRDRSRAVRLAPPHGLTLERVGYGRGWPAAPPPFARAGPWPG